MDRQRGRSVMVRSTTWCTGVSTCSPEAGGSGRAVYGKVSRCQNRSGFDPKTPAGGGGCRRWLDAIVSKMEMQMKDGRGGRGISAHGDASERSLR